MLRYLNRLKNKKGFTLVELVVIMAIIAVIGTAMVTTMLSGSTEKFLAANTNAESFFTATQLAFTRMQFTERALAKGVAPEDMLINYTNGKNTIKNNTYIFLEAKLSGTGVEYVHISNTLPKLANMSEVKLQTALEEYIAVQLENNINESYDGFFYAQIDHNFRVICTHYAELRLPTPTALGSAYRSQLQYTSDGKINNVVMGACMDGSFFGGAGEYAFNAPGADNALEQIKFFG